MKKKYLLITLLIFILFACGKNDGTEYEILENTATKGDLIILGLLLISFN